MEEPIIFQSEVHHDLKNTKEFYRINQDSYWRNIFFRIITIFMMAYLFSSLNQSFTARMVFGLSLFCPGVWLFQWFRNRDGGIAYKRMVRNNNDQIPHIMITVDKEGIHTRNLASGKEVLTHFDTCRYIMESKNLLIIVDDLKSAHVLDKSTLTGGSRDELVSFLRQKCSKLKKRVRFGKFGRVLRYAIYGVMILALLASTAVLLHIPDKLAGKITNDMSYEEMAEELAPLGITIDPATIKEMEAYEDSAWDLPSFRYEDYAKVLYLLSWEGMGKYDWDTWEWTPSESGVYWFDTEVMNISTMYTDFLTGVDAMDESLSFSNIAEDYSRADLESGIGIVTLSFDYLGQTYTVNAQYNYDWFDTDVLHELGRILNSDGDPKDLWYTFDGQGVLLYYGTWEEARALERKTGLYFLDPVNQPLYHY